MVQFCWFIFGLHFLTIHLYGNERTLSETEQDTLRKAPVIGALDLFFPAPVVAGGSRSEYEIAQKILSKKRYFIQCYTNHITRYDDLVFRSRFEIVILPNGEVESVQIVLRGTKNQSMLSCFRNVFRQILFEPDPSGQKTLVQQSLVFQIIR